MSSPLVLVSGHPEDFADGPPYTPQPLSQQSDAALTMPPTPTLVKQATLREALVYLAMHGLRSWTSGTADTMMTAEDGVEKEEASPRHPGAALLAALRKFTPALIDVRVVSTTGEHSSSQPVFELIGLPAMTPSALSTARSVWHSNVLHIIEKHTQQERRREIRKYFDQHNKLPGMSLDDQVDLLRRECSGDGASNLVLQELNEAMCLWQTSPLSPVTALPVVCHVRLENLVGHMTYPCVLDIKVGCVRFHPCTPHKKRSKITTQEIDRVDSTVRQLGLRVCGAQHYAFEQSCELPGAVPAPLLVCNKVPKEFGHSAISSKDSLRACLHQFFSPLATIADAASCFPSNATPPVGCAAVAAHAAAMRDVVRHTLQDIVDTLDAHKEGLDDHVAFVSSSVLITYDAAGWLPIVSSPQQHQPLSPSGVRVALIDFGRCGRRELNFPETRTRYRWALENLMDLL